MVKGFRKIEGEHVHIVPYKIPESISKISCPQITFAQVSYSSAATGVKNRMDCCAGDSLVSSCWFCLDGGECGTVRNCSGCLSFWTDRLFLHQTDSDRIAQNHYSHPSSFFKELNAKKCWNLNDWLWLSGLDSAWVVCDKSYLWAVDLALFVGCFSGFYFLPRSDWSRADCNQKG